MDWAIARRIAVPKVGVVTVVRRLTPPSERLIEINAGARPMKTMTRLSGGLLVVGVLTALGGQAQATGLPACMQAEADLEADEVRVEGNFRSCSKPSVWLGQAGGSY